MHDIYIYMSSPGESGHLCDQDSFGDQLTSFKVTALCRLHCMQILLVLIDIRVLHWLSLYSFLSIFIHINGGNDNIYKGGMSG